LGRAIDITCSALLEAMASIGPGQFEYEIQATIDYVFMRYGAQRPGFSSIVGSGPNSCVLHHSANRRRAVKGDLVVLDVGAELFGYTADVTRTVPVSGRFSPRQREIYEIVLAAQKAGIAAVRPGVKLRDVHAAARKVIRDAGYARYFLHSTSHWLGLDVHDVGATSRTLEEGMVLTVEPGIYLSEEELGIRIEDDVLVTRNGRQVLSDGVPRSVKEIEALMKGRGVGARNVAPLPDRRVEGKKTRYFHLAPDVR
jgi:Xaa-Pro aminopeptidase